MDNQDKATFSLDDDEVVEEEFIERDEEYDDGENYDEEYADDEEYDDGEDYDEDYGDEEYDDGEDYDDGYNDDYYDDRLNKVLDEIAELKRGMMPAPVQQQQQPQPPQPIMPQYIYQPSAPPAGSEVVMYNEISRLRDELAKNQSSLEMQKELSRLKEDMVRDQKIAEAQYNSEIQRLQSRIDDLLKNGSGPQSELSEGQEPTHVEGGKTTLELDRLLSINESVLRAMRDSDARMQSEIGQLKKQLDEIPSLKELNGAVSAVKKAASNVDGINSETLSKIISDIAALRTAIDEKGAAATSAVTVAAPVISAAKSGDVNTSELLRQLYDIKNTLGNSAEAVVKRTQVLSDLVNDFKKVNFDVHSQSTLYKDKLAAVYGYAKKLEETDDQDAVDLINATNEIIAELAAQPLTRSTFADAAAYCSESGVAPVSTTMRDNAERFFNIKDKLASAPVRVIGEYLSDLNAVVNSLQNNRRNAENAQVVATIGEELKSETPDEDTITSLAEELLDLKVSDVIALPDVVMPKVYIPAHASGEESLFGKLAELKAAVLENAAARTESVAVRAEGATTENAAAIDDSKLNELFTAFEELKAALASVTENSDVVGALEEVRANYLDVSNKLVDISEKIQQPVSVEVDSAAPAMSDEETQQALDDLAYIRTKLDEHEEFISQIGDLRAEIIGMGNNADVSEPVADQINSLLTEINTQFDKLYEDLSNVLIESEANIIGRMGESGENPAEAVENAKTDILAETQSIKDSLITVTDAIFALPMNDTIDALRADILAETQAIKDSIAAADADSSVAAVADSIEQLRADVSAFIDSVSANTEIATADRQKLIDDVSFLREQAELAISESDIPADSDAVATADDDKITAYLDDISARVAQIAVVADDAAVVKDTVSALNDNVAVISDNILTVADNMTTINDNIAAVSEGVTALSDAVNPIADNAQAARDAAAAALDALAPIADQLNSILDRLDATVQESEEYADDAVQAENAPAVGESVSAEELSELKDSLNTILDTLPLFPQADDVITARDNTFAILDSLTLMPQADDVSITRDNVSAMLDIVTALSDNIDAAINANSVGGLAEDMAALRESAEGTAEDVKFIRQKLEEAPAPSDEQVEDLANIMQDIGLILDKIEEYERTSANNKQEIIDAVGGIREEFHINTLDETMSAAGIDGETREALVGEITDIRERLGNIESATQSANEVNAASLDGITAQLADLQAILVDRLSVNAEQSEPAGGTMTDDNMQALIDELAAIREKLDASTEYDTVEEILSLREDIKAARIVDQDEVTGELEAIKNELASISSGNILDEIRALREDIVNLPASDGAQAPTDGEINLVLNEIVSLRDEVFAFKDEVLNATATVEPQADGEAPVMEDAADDLGLIIDEITALRADQTALTDNIDELKDIISRRTSIGVAEGEEQDGVAPVSGGLDVVLDEIINLKNDIDRIEESVGGERLNAIAEQVEEIRAVIDELRGGEAFDAQPAEEQSVSVDLTPIMEQFDALNAAIDDIRLNQEAGGIDGGDSAAQGTIADRFEELRSELAEVKAAVTDNVPVDYSNEIDELRAEINALRAENEQLKQANNDVVAAELAELKEAIRDMTLATAPVQTADGDTSYAVLIDEIRGLKEQVAAVSAAPATTSLDEDTVAAIRDALAAAQPAPELGGELAEIRDEIAQLRSLTAVSAGGDGIAEVAAMRDEIAELKEMLSSSDSMVGVAEDLTAIRTDVQTLKEEPDLGVMNEILALRDEFQSLREQIEEVKRIAGETDREADDTLMNEVQSLRDQLFAISMANVNDPSSGESNYESYNNIILDELASIRDQVNAAGNSVDFTAVTDELEELKATIEKREQLFDVLSERVSKLNSDATNNKILEELASLRTDMANQRDADLTTLNFMSEMAHLLERQNQYLTQNAGSKISDEIESLKAEIASSDAVAEEVAKLREIMTQSGSASDNETILNELADLREELSSEKPSRENELILDAIARLRDEITVLAEREKVRDMNSDADLSDSLSDLKEQLNEIAGIVEPAERKSTVVEDKPQTVKPATGGAKRGRKPGSKNGAKSKTSRSASASSKSSSTSKSTGGAKRGRKPANKTAVAEQTSVTTQSVVNPNPITAIIEPVTTSLDIDARIDEQMSKLVGDNEMSLNVKATNTTDAMDVADKLAKQVANKLIMEQLVEQLGDGGVSDDRVDEILRDILPQEFTTIAETEASDKVRRLANQLVLDKLRARLNGKHIDDDK